MQDRTSEAYEVINAQGKGPAVLLCEHASAYIPKRYAGLGLGPEARESHAAWDPGARALAVLLSGDLGAPLIAGRVSRLVYDCNRPPEAPSAMPERSEIFDIPGNVGLSEAQREERIETVYLPFSSAVIGHVAARKALHPVFALITVHSFSPLWFGTPREVEIGLLHDADSRLADAMMAQAKLVPHRVIRRNEPYGPQDGVTHSLTIYGGAQALPNVMIEVRNDLLTTPEDRAAVAADLMTLLAPALADLGLSAPALPDLETARHTAKPEGDADA